MPEDTKVCGEAGTQPSLRLPPLREGRHQKLLQAAVSLRHCAESQTIQSGDAIIIMDGGREGVLTFRCWWVLAKFSININIINIDHNN